MNTQTNIGERMKIWRKTSTEKRAQEKRPDHQLSSSGNDAIKRCD
jgi:hypothetical protein